MPVGATFLFTGVLFVSLFSKPKATVGKLLIPFTTPTPKYEPLMGAVAPPPPDSNVRQGNVAMPTPTPKSPSSFKMGKIKVLTDEEQKRQAS